MTREEMITEITRMDTAIYRRSGLNIDRKYRREPRQYRTIMSKIYKKLEDFELKYLYETKKAQLVEPILNHEQTNTK